MSVLFDRGQPFLLRLNFERRKTAARTICKSLTLAAGDILCTLCRRAGKSTEAGFRDNLLLSFKLIFRSEPSSEKFPSALLSKRFLADI